MLLIHVGAIRSLWSALTVGAASTDWAVGGLRLIVLLASATLFALKVADVACLRLRPGWRPLIASVVVVALLHVSVLRRAVEGDSPYGPAPIAALAVVGTLVESSTLRRSLLRLARVAVGDEGAVARTVSQLSVRAHRLRDPRAPLQFMLVSGLLLPRPPPLR